MPEGPLGIPRPFLSEQGLITLDIWDREITETQAASADEEIFKVNIAPDQTNIVFNRNRIPLSDINKYASDMSLDKETSWVGGSKVIVGRGPKPLFEDTMLDQRLLVILRDENLTERDVESILGDLTEPLAISKVNGAITFTTHVISINMANKAAESLELPKDDFVFQAGILEVEEKLITSG